jgi:hypothetical protein
MSLKPIKTGREFEQLVTSINKHLHKIATVTPNDKLPDKDNGDLRQVDISVRISDGPSKFLGIIEVRDRSRPVGIGYVEEVSAKRTSVGANNAWIVSKAGFWKSAKLKADALGIGVISYKVALKSDWSEFFHLMEDFGVQTRRYNKVKVFFLKKDSQDVIDPHSELRDAIRANSDAPVLLNAKGAPAASLVQIAKAVIDSVGDQVYSKLEPGAPPQRTRIRFTGNLEPLLFFKDATGAIRRIEDLLVAVDLWIEVKRYPITMQQYKDFGTDEVHAEVATSTVPLGDGKYEFQLIALEPGKFRTQETKMVLGVHKR